jgi:hypothetical protein
LGQQAVRQVSGKVVLDWVDFESQKSVASQGCQIFLAATYQNEKKYMPNDYIMYQMAVNYTQWP